MSQRVARSKVAGPKVPGPRSLLAASCLALVTGAALSACSRHAAAVYDVDPSEVVPGLIEVEVRGVTAEHHARLAALGELLEEQVVEEEDSDALLPRDRFAETVFVVRTSGDAEAVAAALTALRAQDDVIYAEPVVKLHALGWTPDDPDFAKQWHLRAAGVQQAWDMTRGAGVTVAVIDTGIAPVDDLDAARLLKGHNFVLGSKPDDATDDHGHGTHVAGTIAQSTGNGKGVAGMAPLADLLPLKVLGRDGSGTSAGIADAIRYAADHGARVLNLSLGGGGRSEAMAMAVAYARRKGCLVVAAAGNSGSRGVSYPAAYQGAMAISATGPQGRLAPYSSFGPQVSLAAPGGDKSQGEESGVLQQTIDEDGKPAYLWFQGTSMATPHVAGAAALVYSVGVTNPAAVERLLESSARSPAGLDEATFPHGAGAANAAELYGAGLLDAGSAVFTATFWWGLSRLLLAIAGAWFAIAHARKLGQLRPSEKLGVPFGLALAAGAGALPALAPLGLARVSFLGMLALPPAGMGAWFLGQPGTSLAATGAAYLGWSAALPLGAALVARAIARSGRPTGNPFGALAAGLSFGWAGLLLHAALLRAVYLPWMPSAVVPVWLVIGAVVSWGAGRGLLAPGDRL
jgi:serine protease